MKPIIKREAEETILTSEINEKHIIVSIIEGQPCILTKGYYQSQDQQSFKVISDKFTIGNSYYSNGFETIERIVSHAIMKKNKVEVFHEKDWKKALQWLIDNCE